MGFNIDGRFQMFSASVILCFVILQVQGHGGHGNTAPDAAHEKLNFNDPKITQDEAHIKEHMKDQIDTNRHMSPQELEFHYFRLHDSNNDTKLDGLEILAALGHAGNMFEVKDHEKIGKTEEQITLLVRARSEQSMLYFSEMIDKVLIEDDFNRDGYVSYPEYVTARRRDMQQFQMQMSNQQQNVAMQQQMAMQQQAQMAQFQQFQQWQAQHPGQAPPAQFQGQPQLGQQPPPGAHPPPPPPPQQRPPPGVPPQKI